ncbi:hypothetical protein DFS33DRAFT_1393334 [Desarmillaria ectypa]|nr:hypothetical protein DFS33DRAFT_1393334 [Desarmillaria ectypa]
MANTISLNNRSLWSTFLLASAAILLRRFTQRPRRVSKVPKTDERVLILGASTGIGREIALQYSSRGAKVCVVGRREHLLTELVNECKALGHNVLAVTGDVASADDMIRVRSILETGWNGLDTVILSAGVSALQPILSVAGIEDQENATTLPDIDSEGVNRTVSITEAAVRGNYIGPMVVAVTFIPLLTRTSKAPSILQISSLGAVVPAATRALYGSTKAASLVLYQALASEHPSISFSFVLPVTVEGSFRASAVDQGAVREADPNKGGLKLSHVARRCITAVDNVEKIVFMPGWIRIAHWLYWLRPGFIEPATRAKYNFHPKI